MIVKFLASKKSRGASATSYLLNKKRVADGTARIIKGDRKITDNIIKNIRFTQKATMGVLSFKEKNLDEKIKQEIMSSFEKLMFPGMHENNYNILWVEHIDKGILELNFVIPKIELSTKKSFNPYFDRADRSRVDIWKKIQNNKYGLHSPDDEKNKQSFTATKNKKFNELTKILEKNIIENIARNTITSRSDIIEYIKKNGIKVDTTNPKILKIKHEKSKKWIRLKGEIYSEKFRNITSLRDIVTDTKRRIDEDERRDRKAENKELEKRLSCYQNQKISQINKLYNYLDNNYINDNSNAKGQDNISISDLLVRAKQDRAEQERFAAEEEERRARAKEEERRARAEQERLAEENRLLREREFERNRELEAEAKAREERERILQETHERIRAETRRKRAIDRLKERKQINELRARTRQAREQIQADAREHKTRLREDITRARSDTRARIKKFDKESERATQSFVYAIRKFGEGIRELAEKIRKFGEKIQTRSVKKTKRNNKIQPRR